MDAGKRSQSQRNKYKKLWLKLSQWYRSCKYRILQLVARIWLMITPSKTALMWAKGHHFQIFSIGGKSQFWALNSFLTIMILKMWKSSIKQIYFKGTLEKKPLLHDVTYILLTIQLLVSSDYTGRYFISRISTVKSEALTQEAMMCFNMVYIQRSIK